MLREATPFAAGAWGPIQAGTDPLGRRVLLKTLDARLATRPEAVRGFERAYQALLALDHPAFARGLSQGFDEAGLPYYTVSKVEGAPLLDTPPMPAHCARACLKDLAEALGHMHARGWVHGDMRPAHVRVTSDMHLRVIDVQAMRRVGEVAKELPGNLDFVAPEVLAGAVAAPAQDLYALGAMGYRLWTGRTPFEGTPVERMRGHLLQTPAPPGSWAFDRDPELDALILALLAKDPAERPSVEQVLAVLGRGKAPPKEAVPGTAAVEAGAMGARAVPLEQLEAKAAAWEALREVERPREGLPELPGLERAAALARTDGALACENVALRALGHGRLLHGDLFGAQSAFQRRAALLAAAGWQPEAGYAQLDLALAAAERGDFKQALAAAEAALAQLPAEDRGLALAYAVVGQVRARQGQASDAFEQARAHAGDALLERQVAALEHEEASTCWWEAADRVAAHRARRCSAEAALKEGRVEEAIAHARVALAIAEDWQSPYHEPRDRALLEAALAARQQASPSA